MLVSQLSGVYEILRMSKYSEENVTLLREDAMGLSDFFIILIILFVITALLIFFDSKRNNRTLLESVNQQTDKDMEEIKQLRKEEITILKELVKELKNVNQSLNKHK